jgi:peptidyl-prolyl cis-trans isomerase D
MLQQIRDKITGWFAAVFLGAIAVVFVFWGIQFESSSNVAAAKVNGESISAEQVRRAWQQRQSELQQSMRDELPPALVKEEQAKLLNDSVRREVLVQHVNKMGYRVSDQAIVSQLAQIPALQVDGKFSRDRYAALLRQQGTSEAEFEVEFRRDLEIGQLQNGVGVSAFATPGEVKRRIELQGETREIDYVTIPAAKFAGQAVVTPADVLALYEKNKASYKTEETVSLQYLQLKLADVAAAVPVTEEGLREYYEQVAPERFQDPERRRARHILIESGTDDAAAKKKADDVFAQAKAGGDFAKLAAQYSDDPGSKAQGGELGWSTREAFVKPFADAVFAMQVGEVRGPVKTQFGYHVIQLEEVQAPHQRSFDEVRAELESEYRDDKAQSLFYEQSQQLADESFASLSELDSVAKKLGLQVQTVDAYTRRGGGGPFGSDRKVIEAVFSDDVLQQRQNSPAINFGDDSAIVLRVTDYKPSAQRSIDEMRPELEAGLRAQAVRKAAVAAASAEAARLNSGASFADVAKGLGLQPAGAVTLTRTTETTPAPLIKAAYAVPRPAPGKVGSGTAVLPGGDIALFVVTDVKSGALPTTPDAGPLVTQLAQQIAGQGAGIEFSAYVAELVRNAKVQLNEKVFE